MMDFLGLWWRSGGSRERVPGWVKADYFLYGSLEENKLIGWLDVPVLSGKIQDNVLMGSLDVSSFYGDIQKTVMVN